MMINFTYLVAKTDVFKATITSGALISKQKHGHSLNQITTIKPKMITIQIMISLQLLILTVVS